MIALLQTPNLAGINEWMNEWMALNKQSVVNAERVHLAIVSRSMDGCFVHSDQWLCFCITLCETYPMSFHPTEPDYLDYIRGDAATLGIWRSRARIWIWIPQHGHQHCALRTKHVCWLLSGLGIVWMAAGAIRLGWSNENWDIVGNRRTLIPHFTEENVQFNLKYCIKRYQFTLSANWTRIIFIKYCPFRPCPTMHVLKCQSLNTNNIGLPVKIINFKLVIQNFFNANYIKRYLIHLKKNTYFEKVVKFKIQ